MKRLALIYALLVGLPLGGLLAILRAGAGIEAPTSIGGSWRVEIDGEPVGPLAMILTSENAGFRISQSGDRFDLKPHGSAQSPAHGRLTGRSVKAERRRRTGELDWTIEGTLGPTSETISGTWSFVTTATTTLRFTATRTESSRGKGE